MSTRTLMTLFLLLLGIATAGAQAPVSSPSSQRKTSSLSVVNGAGLSQSLEGEAYLNEVLQEYAPLHLEVEFAYLPVSIFGGNHVSRHGAERQRVNESIDNRVRCVVDITAGKVEFDFIVSTAWYATVEEMSETESFLSDLASSIYTKDESGQFYNIYWCIAATLRTFQDAKNFIDSPVGSLDNGPVLRPTICGGSSLDDTDEIYILVNGDRSYLDMAGHFIFIPCGSKISFWPDSSPFAGLVRSFILFEGNSSYRYTAWEYTEDKVSSVRTKLNTAKVFSGYGYLKEATRSGRAEIFKYEYHADGGIGTRYAANVRKEASVGNVTACESNRGPETSGFVAGRFWTPTALDLSDPATDPYNWYPSNLPNYVGVGYFKDRSEMNAEGQGEFQVFDWNLQEMVSIQGSRSSFSIPCAVSAVSLNDIQEAISQSGRGLMGRYEDGTIVGYCVVNGGRQLIATYECQGDRYYYRRIQGTNASGMWVPIDPTWHSLDQGIIDLLMDGAALMGKVGLVGVAIAAPHAVGMAVLATSESLVLAAVVSAATDISLAGVESVVMYYSDINMGINEVEAEARALRNFSINASLGAIGPIGDFGMMAYKAKQAGKLADGIMAIKGVDGVTKYRSVANVYDASKDLNAARRAAFHNEISGSTELAQLMFSRDPTKVVKAWEVLFDFPLLRKIPANLNAVNAFEAMVPGSLARVKTAMTSLAADSRQAFINGLQSCADNSALAQSLSKMKLPSVDDILNATTKIKQHRVDVGIPSAKNFGYLEGNLSGGSISNLPGTVVSSGPAVPVNQQIFNAIDVGGWARYTDSEYKMLNQLARDLGAVPGGSNVNTAINGTLKIVSERAYCASCQGVIQQFNQLFPNIEIKLVDGVR